LQELKLFYFNQQEVLIANSLAQNQAKQNKFPAKLTQYPSMQNWFTEKLARHPAGSNIISGKLTQNPTKIL
jgi:hypothetical protein